jgi:CheY-like chemotaxis protein
MTEGAPVVILLVEDDPAHAEMVRRSLADARVANRVVHVEDGQAAVDYLRLEGAGPALAGADAPPRPDLVLLDLRLPKVDGLEVLRRLKADPATRGIPAVILTTSAAESDVVRAYDGGAASFLVKPVDFAKLKSLMDAFGFYWLVWNRFPG